MDTPRRRIEGEILPDPRPTRVSLVWKLDRFYSLLPIGQRIRGLATNVRFAQHGQIWPLCHVKQPNQSDPTGGSYLFGSPSFCFLDAEWWLLISPTITQEPRAPLQIALGLHILPSSSRRSVFYKFGIRGSDGTEIGTGSKKKEFVPDPLVLHRVTTLSKQDRDRYLPGGNLTVFCNLWTAGETREAACLMDGPQGVLGLLRDLKTLFLSGKNTDLTLNVGGREFGAHRSILRARSPVFAAMLQHDMSEKISSTVEIPDCDPEAFRHFLLYLYSGAVEDLSENNVVHLYRAADKYDVEDLKAECVDFIKSNLSVDMFCDVAALALTHDEPELLQEVTQFFTKNLEAITVSTALHTFLEENPVAGRDMYTKALKHRGVIK